MNSIVNFETRWNYRLVAWPIMAFSFAFIVWASFFEIDESVVGSGVVIPSGETKVIQHLEGGIVDTIYIKEGDNVKKNDKLFKLSQAFFLSDQKSKEIELWALFAQEIRLQAEIDAKEKLEFDKKLSFSVPQVIKNEINIFRVDRQTYQNQEKILQDKINKKGFEIQEVQNKLANLDLELKIAKESVEIQEKLVKQGAASRQQYLQKLAEKQNLVTEHKSLLDKLPILEEELKENKQELDKFYNEEHSKRLNELRETQLKIQQLEQKTIADSDRESRKTILSPVNGTVKKLYFHTIGGIVKAGDPIVEITPIGDKLMIKGEIKTSDRARVWSGQKVSVSITAYDFSKYGSLEGTLVAISPDSFTDEKGNSFYEIKVITDKISFGENEMVLPGMSAQINILTGKKTIMQYILKPLKDIQKNALREH